VIVKRVVFTAVGILSLTLVAAGLTELTLALGHQGKLVDSPTARPSVLPSPSATSTPSPTPVLTPVSTPVVTPVPTPKPGTTAVTNGYVRLRAGASTSTAILAELNAGTVLILGPYRDSQWQQVTYNGINGYVFRTYLIYR
jgi:hypothetical protein